LVRALERLRDVRALEIGCRRPHTLRQRFLLPSPASPVRPRLQRLSGLPSRRLATLVAFVYSLEATAQDEALEVPKMLLHDLFGHATSGPTPKRGCVLTAPSVATASNPKTSPTISSSPKSSVINSWDRTHPSQSGQVTRILYSIALPKVSSFILSTM
jgi:hypothetical protein